MQNFTTVHCFVLHATHGWKAYHVSFPTQQTSHHLDFSIRSYDRFSGDCTEDQQPREAPRVFSSCWLLSYHNSRNSKSHSHPTRRVVPCISTPCISKMNKDFDNEIEPLFVQLCDNKFREWSLPLCSCDFPWNYRSGRFIGTQSVLLLLHVQVA